MPSTLQISRASSLWYPIMLTEASGEISEAKAAELLGLNLTAYRVYKERAIDAVLTLVSEFPSPLTSLVEALREKPELFD